MRDRDDAPLEDEDDLAVRLRAAAVAERPTFSPELHARLLARSVPARANRAITWRRMALPALAGGLVAVVAAVVVVSPATVRPPKTEPPRDVAVAGVVPGIERLPTLAEVEEGVVASVTAALVDLPPWLDLVAVDPAEFGADDGGP